MIEGALGLLFPSVCQICRQARASAQEGYVCQGCSKSVRFLTPPFCERCGLPFEGSITGLFECSNCCDTDFGFNSARSAVQANDVVLEAIHRFKYNRAMWFEPFLADLLIRAASEDLSADDWDVLVPVPLHPTRRREREFNQAERLAKHLGKELNLPVERSWLRRVQRTHTQTTLTRSQRAGNVRKAFAIKPGLKLDGQRIVLIDDVFTTGATTSACAHTLRAAGAGDVCVWTVARGV